MLSVNDTQSDKLQGQFNLEFAKIESWILLILLYTTNQSFIIPLGSTYKEYICLNKVIDQIDRTWMVASCTSFTECYGQLLIYSSFYSFFIILETLSYPEVFLFHFSKKTAMEILTFSFVVLS